jgi:hypothetical protein
MRRSDDVAMPELQDKSIRSIKMVQTKAMMEPAENFVLHMGLRTAGNPSQTMNCGVLEK